MIIVLFSISEVQFSISNFFNAQENIIFLLMFLLSEHLKKCSGKNNIFTNVLVIRTFIEELFLLLTIKQSRK